MQTFSCSYHDQWDTDCSCSFSAVLIGKSFGTEVNECWITLRWRPFYDKAHNRTHKLQQALNCTNAAELQTFFRRWEEPPPLITDLCSLLPGCQSTAARGREPRSGSSSRGGGLPRRYAVGEDPKRASGHRPVATPNPQRSAEPAGGGGLLMPVGPSCFYLQSVWTHQWRKYQIFQSSIFLVHNSIDYMFKSHYWEETFRSYFLLVCARVLVYESWSVRFVLPI